MLTGLGTSKIVAATLELLFGSRVLLKNTCYPVYCVFQETEHGLLEFRWVRVDGTAWWGLRGFRNERPLEQYVQLLTWDDCSVHGQRSSPGIRETRKGASRRTRHVDTKVYFMQAFGQRLLKVHGDSQQVADCRTKIMTPQAAHRPGSLTDAAFCRTSMRSSILSNIDEGVRKIAAHQNTASDLNTFTDTFPDNMRMKFVMTITLLCTQHVAGW